MGNKYPSDRRERRAEKRSKRQDVDREIREAPKTCLYCWGTGLVAATPGQPLDGYAQCGFCDGGKPLDTQEDWDRTWGRTWDQVDEIHEAHIVRGEE